MAMDLPRTSVDTASPTGLPTGKTRRRALVPLTALALWACASVPADSLEQGGLVPDANAAVHCPRGTVFAAGQTMGRLSAVWCEKPDGRRHGPYVEWWENHQKKGAGLYQDGVRHGVWTFFLNNGQRDSQVEYRNGEATSSPSPPATPAPQSAAPPS